MTRIRFTMSERELLADLLFRGSHIVEKMVAIIGSRALRRPASPEFPIDLDDLLGRGRDRIDCGRMARELAKIPGIVERAEFGKEKLLIRFREDALTLLRKLAIQGRERCFRDGDGEAFCMAMLELKRAFGFRDDVWFHEDFCYENFDFGEDVSYMRRAFNSAKWRLEFTDGKRRPRIMIRVMPIWPDRERLAVSRIIMRGYRSRRLCIVSRAEFIDPERWGRLIPQIVARAKI